MIKKYLIVSVFVVIVGVSLFFWFGMNGGLFKNNLPVACTMEAKICPDGSAVGRTGPLCEFAKCPLVSTTPYTVNDVVLGIGQTGKVGDLNIKLDAIVQDSRCPVGVQCVWAGQVEAKIMLTDVSKSEVVNISSGQAPHLFDGFNVSIISITPSRESKKEIMADEYRVTFHVVKLPNNDVVKDTGVINGSVTLSPVCPVERMPPDPKCTPRPFETEIRALTLNGNKLVKAVRSQNDGSFTLTLPYGNYVIQATGGNPYPRCPSINLTLQTSIVNNINLSCDTGIR